MSRNLPSIPAPVDTDFGMLALVARRPEVWGGQWMLHLRLPPGAEEGHAATAGRYFLARCGAVDEWEREHRWSHYLRRPLFEVQRRPVPDGQEEEWSLALSANTALWGMNGEGPEPHGQWLLERRPGEAIHLLPAMGRGFHLAETTRNLLVMADGRRLAPLIPLMDLVLDRNGRVTLLLMQPLAGEHPFPVNRLPLAVEVHLSEDEAGWLGHLNETALWADQMAVAAPQHALAGIGAQIRGRRFSLSAGFAQALVETPLVCGVGACLACVVPLARGGLTRACVNGPFLDLTLLTAG